LVLGELNLSAFRFTFALAATTENVEHVLRFVFVGLKTPQAHHLAVADVQR
jgi:hypothetical protein